MLLKAAFYANNLRIISIECCYIKHCLNEKQKIKFIANQN
ncbi:hypothetical protein A1OE_911 [Candidatus Endolissoclinum faulkneri L2]|uniref:Uncharacterized protein n=1 Tax=Candidatus Endolissoclinum faulkneri L2 TaxID=1193729 RepID=K7YHN6_9PROT|nr:hypothetical protein A1OE_911 [Candidatus Endolissoclinum faulkneri L2]